MSASTNKAQREAWAAEQIARADRYTVVMFRGFPDGHDKRWAASLREARRIRRAMLAEYADTNYRRRPIIYAVVPPYDITIHVE